MRYFALADIPNGIPAGQEFDATEDEGNVLILVGAARLAGEPAPPVRRSPPPRPRRDPKPESEPVSN